MPKRRKEEKKKGEKRMRIYAEQTPALIHTSTQQIRQRLEEDERAADLRLQEYKIYLIFFIGSFAGVLVEMLWCLLRNGYIASRAGVVYGPLNPLYGFGALLLSVTLYKYRNRGAEFSFIGGMIVGSVLEYVVSWGQEAQNALEELIDARFPDERLEQIYENMEFRTQQTVYEENN